MASGQQGNPVAQYPALEREPIPRSVKALRVGAKDVVSLAVLNLKAQHRKTTQRMYMITWALQSKNVQAGPGERYPDDQIILQCLPSICNFQRLTTLT